MMLVWEITINIITKKGGEKPFTSLTTSFGENHTQNYIVNHGASFGKFNYWITGSQRKTDGFELSDRFNSDNKRTGLGTDFNEDGGIRDLSYYKKNTFSAKIGYEYDHNSQVSISFDYHDNEKGCPTEDNRYWEFSKWNQWHMNLVGEHDVTEILTLKARLYYVDHEDTLEDVSWDTDHTTSKKWFEKSLWDDYTVGGEIHAYFDFGELSLIKMGVSYMKDNHVQYDVFDETTRNVLSGKASVGVQPEEEYEIDVYSYGIEDEVLLFDERLSLNGGVSFDVHKPVKASDGTKRDKTSSWNPQAGIAFDITNDLNIYTSIGKKTKFPQIGELYSNLAGGNSSLKPQKTIAYEIGVNKKFNSVFNFHTAFFYNDIEDRIIRIRNRVTGDKEYVNQGESVIKGLETRLDITTPWNLDIGLGYTYITSKDRDDKDSVWTETKNIPEHKATLDARYAFDFGLSTSFQAVYTGNQVEYDRLDNKIKIDDFIVCNFRLNQKLNFIPKITTNFFVEVSNVFDENYDEGNDPYPGRNFLAGITFTF